MEDEEKEKLLQFHIVCNKTRASSDERNVFKLIYEMCGECVALN